MGYFAFLFDLLEERELCFLLKEKNNNDVMDIKRKRKQIFDLYPSELLRRIVKTEKAFMQTYGRTLFFFFSRSK